MINWDNFYVFAAISVCLWLAGAVFSLRSSTKSKAATAFTSASIIILGIFIAGLWVFLQRPPLRTMGETRLWYSFFMGVAGLLTYIRWKYRWILSFSTLLSTVFIIINLMKPEIHDQSLMPALQSIWFIPHVTVYMFSYSVLGCAFIIAVTGLFHHKEEYLHTADNLVYAGVAFLSIGMLLGSLWAKEAWGKLLELGSERNLGGYHLDGIPALYTSPPFQKSRAEKPVRTAHRLLPRPANVLVWSELLAGRPTKRALI